MLENANHNRNQSQTFRTFERALSAFFVIALLLSVVATIGVMFSGIPPLFNQPPAVYTLANALTLVAFLALAVALIVTGRVARFYALRRALMLVLVALATLEGLLFVFDRAFISSIGSPMQWAFRNVSIHGEQIWLPQPTSSSIFGFRNRPISSHVNGVYRVLFLGNSFVSGSGTTFDTNYPQVVEAGLRAALPNKTVQVFSAGVDGFGSKEDRLIYEYLLEQGYKFDLVVPNFNLGSDPTGDIPGTFSKAIAGEAQRFPQNWFLRVFYPLDSYLFRYAYYLEITFDPRFGPVDATAPKNATCKPSSSFLTYADRRTWLYYGPGAAKRLYLDYDAAEILKLAKIATAHGAKVFVVLLPDRFAVLPTPSQKVNDPNLDRTWTRRFMLRSLRDKLPVFDLSPYFVDRSDLFQCNGLHWNDPGNVDAGRRVSAHLADFISHIENQLTSTSAFGPSVSRLSRPSHQ